MRTIIQYVFLLGLITTISCVSDPVNTPLNVEGLKPIYTQNIDEIEKIEILDFQLVENLGKIVYVHPYIFVNEKLKGIHLYDNTIPTNPQLIRFIKIPGNIDFAIKGNTIYANNFNDLITISVSGLDSVNVTSRIDDFYENLSLLDTTFPDNYSGYFECIEEEKGFVIGWEEAILHEPRCFR